MQVLCIENGKCPHRSYMTFIPKKGDVCNAYATGPRGLFHKGVDMWHSLEEFRDPKEAAHVSIFIELPSQEGQSFKKETTVEIPQELQPFYEQL